MSTETEKNELLPPPIPGEYTLIPTREQLEVMVAMANAYAKSKLPAKGCHTAESFLI